VESRRGTTRIPLLGIFELLPQPRGLSWHDLSCCIVEGSGDRIDEERPALIGEEGSPDLQAPPPSAKERRLKGLIANSPFLVIDADERPTAVATEVQMPGAGSADVVVVDAEGKITIVECKLEKNPESRRWVIGQLLEYAAALWKLDIENFERSLAARSTALIQPFQDPALWKEPTFRSTVSRNLADGAFRLVIAVDEITERLKRTVVFINSLTPPEVRFLALVLPRGGEEGVQRPVPVFVGDDSAEIGPLLPTLKPDRWTLMASIRNADGARVAEGLLGWAESKQLDIRYTESAAIIATPGGRLFRISYEGEVRVSRHTLTPRGESWDGGRINRFVQDLDKIGVRLEGKWPRAPLESLADERERDEFLALMEQASENLTG